MDYKDNLFHSSRISVFKLILLFALFLCFSRSGASEKVEQKKEQGTEKKVKNRTAEKKTVKKKAKKKKESISKPKEETVVIEPKGTTTQEGYTHLPLLETKKSKAEKAKTFKASPEIHDSKVLSSVDHEGRTIFEGPYGSHYVLNKNGKKLYLKHNK